jgi:hypothetical protein
VILGNFKKTDAAFSARDYEGLHGIKIIFPEACFKEVAVAW